MVKYHCEYCKRDLFHNRLNGRIMHNNGQKHNTNKKTYFLEMLEKPVVKKELESVYEQFVYEKHNLFLLNEMDDYQSFKDDASLN